MSEKIGFIGLGIMGRGMVDNLLESRLSRLPSGIAPTSAHGNPSSSKGAACRRFAAQAVAESQRHHHHLRQRHAGC